MSVGRIAVALACLVFAACEYDRDRISAGYYGAVQAGRGGQSGQSGQVTRPPAPGPRTQQQAVAGMMTAGAAGMPAAGAAATPSPAANGCDMSGRWLGTLHTVTDALGNLQYAHSYLYYEISQQADTFSITKGLLCGDDAAGGGSLSVMVDFRASWAAAMSKVSFAGRKGTSAPAASGCQIDLEPWYEVKGATLPHYLDPDVALPTSEQAASGSTPGWEDWDNDGNPGITGTLSGAISGKIFTAPRRWTSASGSAADTKSSIRLALQWDVEANVMGYDGSPLLASSAVRAADSKLHFAQLVRVTPEQVPTSDDAQICKRIVELAPMLTPEASGM